MKKGVVVVENHFMFNKDESPFSVLGIHPAFSLDLEEVERAYFSCQLAMHPDRHTSKTPQEQALISERSALINQSYQALKNPVIRAECLLRLEGIFIPGENASSVQDSDILQESLSLREDLLEAQTLQEMKHLEVVLKDRFSNACVDFEKMFTEKKESDCQRAFLRMTYLSKIQHDLTQRIRQLSSKEL
jgi:molecular chaperone HscB